jgi:hypothetical protein
MHEQKEDDHDIGGKRGKNDRPRVVAKLAKLSKSSQSAAVLHVHMNKFPNQLYL